MKIPLNIAEKLLLLLNGAEIPNSSAQHAIIEELVKERILNRIGMGKKTLRLREKGALHTYLHHKGITDLSLYIGTLKDPNASRADFVSASTDSKMKSVRTFKGFLVNSYLPIAATFNGKPHTIAPAEGMFEFVYDFESFIPSPEAVIVGVENSENFRHISRQAYLFAGIVPLFVSRYPQNQSKDLIKWLRAIPNSYLHFGDFDPAGINIYLSEYKKQLGTKARFLIPDNIPNLLLEKGNKERYDAQKFNFEIGDIEEEALRELIGFIHGCKKGLDQEFFINRVFS